MDAEFVNKYIENLNNEVIGMKKTDIIRTTQNNILEKTTNDLKAEVVTLTAKVVELTDKLNKKVAIQRTSSKKKNDPTPGRDGGEF